MLQCFHDVVSTLSGSRDSVPLIFVELIEFQKLCTDMPSIPGQGSHPGVVVKGSFMASLQSESKSLLRRFQIKSLRRVRDQLMHQADRFQALLVH